MQKYSTMDLQNNATTIREILINNISSELTDMSDKYDIPQEIIDGIELSLYVKHTDKVLWKGGKTRFLKIFEKELRRLVDSGTISFEELGVITYLATELTSYEDNILRIEDEYSSKDDLIEFLVEKSKNQTSRNSVSYFRKLLSKLEGKDLILSIPNPNNKRKKLYYISPLLFYKGQFIDKTIKDLIVSRLES